MKIKKTCIIVFLALYLVSPNFAFAAPDLGLDYAANFNLYGSTSLDPHDTLINIVRYFLTFLTLAAVTVILIGGFRIMVSMGNEDRLAAARKTLSGGFVGLVIMLVSFALVQFVISTTSNVIAEGTI